MRTDRDSDLFRGLRELQEQKPREPRRPRAVRIALIAVLALASVLAGSAAYTWFHVQSKFKNTHNPAIRVAPLPPGEPMNILVLGSDRRDVVEGKDRRKRQYRGGGGQRADSIIVVHISGDRERAVLIHFPRDLRVAIPGRGLGKINGAYNGGPNAMIKTITAFSGLKIHHYVEVNFSSFRSVVDAVGGVNLCVNRALEDERAGLRLPRAGCYDLDGDMALAYVRARYVDADADFGRIRRQQQFMRLLMERVNSIGFLVDLPKVIRLANAVEGGVVTDENLGLGLVKQIAGRLAGFNQQSLDFRVVPSYPQYVGGVSYVLSKKQEALALFRALNQDAKKLPPYGKTPLSIPDPPDVSVTVLNGTTKAGLGGAAAARLREEGFKVRKVANAHRSDVVRTTLLYQPDAALKAKLVARYFPGARLKVTTKRQDADVVVILGTDRLATASPSPR